MNGAASRWRAPAALLCALLACPPAAGHELLQPRVANGYLAQLRALSSATSAANSAPRRGRAWLAMGRLIDSASQLLSRDASAHGGGPSLRASLFVRQLKSLGIELRYRPQAGRYRAHLEPFERALELLPAGHDRAEAMFHVLKGRFYDSFVHDPLRPTSAGWGDFRDAIRRMEHLLERYPGFAQLEEARFMLAVDYLRAALAAPREALRQRFAERARAALSAFARRYPGSLRAGAAAHLLGRVPLKDSRDPAP